MEEAREVMIRRNADLAREYDERESHVRHLFVYISRVRMRSHSYLMNWRGSRETIRALVRGIRSTRLNVIG